MRRRSDNSSFSPLVDLDELVSSSTAVSLVFGQVVVLVLVVSLLMGRHREYLRLKTLFR